MGYRCLVFVFSLTNPADRRITPNIFLCSRTIGLFWNHCPRQPCPWNSVPVSLHRRQNTAYLHAPSNQWNKCTAAHALWTITLTRMNETLQLRPNLWRLTRGEERNRIDFELYNGNCGIWCEWLIGNYFTIHSSNRNTYICREHRLQNGKILNQRHDSRKMESKDRTNENFV